MARHHPQITSVPAHPGAVKTGLLAGTKPSAAELMFQTVPFSSKSAAEGSYNTLWAAAVDSKGLENGAYCEPVSKRTGVPRLAVDAKLAGTLLEWTVKDLQDLEDL